MNRRILLGFIAVISAIFMMSCASAKPGETLGVEFNTVSFIDEGLDQKVKAQVTNAKRTASDTVEVWAVLKNLTGKQVVIEGRASFFDKDEAPVEGPTAWKRVFIPGNSMATYREFSTKVHEVGYYYIEVREGR